MEKQSNEQFAIDVMSGDARGVRASALRTFTHAIEPLYASAMRVRNLAYDRGWRKSFASPVPVISVGNITTGGTGKTPVVQWLVEQLAADGIPSAVLMRGYKSQANAMGDEQRLLHAALNREGRAVQVVASPDRVAGATRIVSEDANVRAIVLDDGFQHRRLQRAFDLVLIDATRPFGFDHVLPRGLLREPLSGLKRANAIALTRMDQVSPDQLEAIEEKIRSVIDRAVPIYRSRHVQRFSDGDIRGMKLFAFCGIGNPESFISGLRSSGGVIVGEHRFDDHHDYGTADLAALESAAAKVGAAALITTEKDWVKIEAMAGRRAMVTPLMRVGVTVEWWATNSVQLLMQIRQRL